MVNKWIVHKDNRYASWSVYLNEHSYHTVDRVQQLLLRFEEVAHGEEICIPWLDKKPFRDVTGLTYSEYAMKALRDPDKGNKSLFQEVYKRETFATRVCHFDQNGQVVTSVVDDLGTLLKTLRPDIKSRKHTYPWEPIRPGGLLIGLKPDLDNLKLHRKVPFLSVTLPTNIWFQHVSDFPDKKFDWTQPPLSNYELSACHTPRLNRFLQGLKEVTYQIDGEWHYECRNSPFNYMRVIHEEGIKVGEKVQEVFSGTFISSAQKDDILRQIFLAMLRVSAIKSTQSNILRSIVITLNDSDAIQNIDGQSWARFIQQVILNDQKQKYEIPALYKKHLDMTEEISLSVDRVYIRYRDKTLCFYEPDFDIWDEVKDFC